MNMQKTRDECIIRKW